MAGSDGRRRLIYNSDGDNMFLYAEPPMEPKDLEPYLEEIAASGVTTLFISPNLGMKVNYPSNVAEMLLPGNLVELGSHRRLAENLNALMRGGHDPLGLIIEMARRRGLEVFVSYRLNEVHAVDDPESPILSTFWKEHPEWHLGKPGNPLPKVYREILGPRVSPVVARWLPGGLNFAVKEVRERRLAELREVCERYPIDGLDLDFQRFPVYFPFGSEAENLGIMGSWISRIRSMMDHLSEKRGRRILLSARVMARPRQNIAIGLDPISWAKDGLLDFITVSHYLRNDFPLPIGEYRSLLPLGMPIYASIEYEPDPEEYTRKAARLWRDGVDGIMLFNFFASREAGREPPFHILKTLADPTVLKSRTK